MSGKILPGIVWVCALATITLVDYVIGPTAEYLNAYEIIRRTLCPDKVPRTENFLLFQDYLGVMALPIGWLLFFMEGGLFAAIVWGIIRTARYILSRG